MTETMKVPLYNKHGRITAAALISKQDDWITRYRWYHFIKDGKDYAARKRGGEVVFMHRFIMKEKDGAIIIDHKDLNTLNNTRDNLRRATRAQNAHNIERHKDNQSGYKGVYWDQQFNRWRTQIMNEGKRVHIGRYATKEEAAVAYDKAAIKLHKEFARTNFPKENYEIH